MSLAGDERQLFRPCGTFYFVRTICQAMNGWAIFEGYRIFVEAVTWERRCIASSWKKAAVSDEKRCEISNERRWVVSDEKAFHHFENSPAL